VYGINTTATKESNSSFESVTEFRYLGTAQTDQNPVYEDIKSRLNLRSACYHSVRNILPS